MVKLNKIVIIGALAGLAALLSGCADYNTPANTGYYYPTSGWDNGCTPCGGYGGYGYNNLGYDKINVSSVPPISGLGTNNA